MRDACHAAPSVRKTYLVSARLIAKQLPTWHQPKAPLHLERVDVVDMLGRTKRLRSEAPALGMIEVDILVGELSVPVQGEQVTVVVYFHVAPLVCA
jgi:hypothetical protein